jgi:hypothetical protein
METTFVWLCCCILVAVTIKCCKPISGNHVALLPKVFMEAIPYWTDYESQKGWIHSAKSQHKKQLEAAIKSHPRWAITAPEVKGAVGLVLYALLAYFPGLCFTNDEKTSDEVRNNRAMAMLPSHHSVAMFSLLEQSGVHHQGRLPSRILGNIGSVPFPSD